MAQDDQQGDQEYDVQRELFRLLVSKVQKDPYPSVTMLNLIEDMMRPDDVPMYASVLWEKIANDRYPSIPLIRRLRRFA